ncbi:MAG: hypothetical protein HY369_05115 [Candidatus Aenigmarchaeota archaeon]|nr:hypothetical protein [Candidatus Aenigmarchaeota archaeon]
MTSSSAAPNVGALLTGAGLSAQAAQVLTIPDLGARIQAGMGIKVDNVPASEVTLVTMLVDDSGSISAAGNTRVVRDGHNMVLDALGKAKRRDGILAHTLYLNGTVLFPYAPLDQAVRMDDSNYDPNLGTPLYDQAVVLLGTVLAKAQQFEDAGVPVRTVTLIVTDGQDEHSSAAHGGRGTTAADVAKVARDMLRKETHIIAAMGIDNGATDFRRVFAEMGIQDKWILTPGNTQQEIRRAFLLFSQSAVRASQGAAPFSQSAMGGFGK